ncbi:MAG: hypothetical protein CBC02_003325 [Flavobacteriaceae bacterium TMED42]|nr:MAG: hypothetical protein CBC02_003325 [Flavobacteriaceae bacterium TMED42]|tara:strand:- start:506 stop:799 length:294 start_codon:yes stop_codon:yes gene_type:complete
MIDKLKKIKLTLKNASEENAKKDILIGQALGQLDSLLDQLESGEEASPLPIPNHVWKHVEKPTNKTMMDAVQRHKEIHHELSRDSVTQKNTHFEQLK